MNNAYLKGIGDFTPDATPDLTDEQIIRATKENAAIVASNCTDREFLPMVRTALMEYFMHGKTDLLDELANESAADLLHRGVL